jgi:hypothetical protein
LSARLFASGRSADPIEVVIPATFTEDEWHTLQASIEGSPRPQRRNQTYPLTGRGRCHLRCSCGGRYSGKTDKYKNRWYYFCSGSPHEFGIERCRLSPRNIRSLDLDGAVWEKVKAATPEAEPT